MDPKYMFSNFNMIWPRWSAYEVRTWHGVNYLMPVPGAEAIPYNCAQQAEKLVSNALELGRQVFLKADGLDCLCTEFAARHGLLGLDIKNAGFIQKSAAAPCYRPFSEFEYGEVLERFQEELLGLYRHFLSTRGELSGQGIELPALSGRVRYRLTAGPTPQIVWEVDSLLAILRLAYAGLITSPAPVLKVCKNCGKVYYNTHIKSEFCGTKCRNNYNVKIFREREKM